MSVITCHRAGGGGAGCPAGMEYNVDMMPEALAAELERDPFNGLRLHLSDGRTVEIINPGLGFIARLALYVFNAKPRHALAEDVEVISLRHIVSVETLAPSEPKKAP